MAKRFFFLSMLLVAVLVFSSSAGLAQQPAGELESMQISIWPDFDEPSVLVLLTGQLPEGTPLPAEVSIPVPENAEINAIAQIDEAGMVSIDFESNEGIVTFTATNPRFRVEYYVPYEESGGLRSYDFDWLSQHSVEELTAEVQQPANAVALATEPAATNIYTNQFDGLTYHGFEPRAVPAGTPYQVSFNYEMVSDELTAASAEQAPVQGSEPAAVQAPEEDNNWLLIAGIVGLVALAIVGTWLVATRGSNKKSTRPAKPKPKARATGKTAAVYCHNCGQAAEAGDSFCRRCGTELKRP